MRNIFFFVSALVFCYLVYYQAVYLSTLVFPDEPSFRQFTEYVPIPSSERMRELRFVHLMLALLSGITFLLYLGRSRGSKRSKNMVKAVLFLNIIIILLCTWQVVSNI